MLVLQCVQSTVTHYNTRDQQYPCITVTKEHLASTATTAATTTATTAIASLVGFDHYCGWLSADQLLT